MIRCVVVDDERPAREEIAYLIKQNEDFQVVKTFESGRDLLMAINDLVVDVVFLDINMPGLSGIETGEILLEQGFDLKLVFVTAYDDYAVKAFDLHAIDYMLKPLSDLRLQKTLMRLKCDFKAKQDLSGLFKQMHQPQQAHFSFYKDGHIVPIKGTEIHYVKAENKGIVVATQKDVFTSNIQLSEMENKLAGHQHFRCHRSYIINLDKIINIEAWFNRTFMVEIEGLDERIPVSRNYVPRFKEIMNIL